MQLFHFNVVCSDFDRSYDFYTQVLGMTPLTSANAGTESTGKRADGRRPGEGRAAAGEGAQVADLLGFDGSGEYRGAFLYWGDKRNGPYIDLLEWDDNLGPVERTPRNVGLSRVAIRVDDLDAELARLAEHGVATLTEPKTLVLGVTKVRVVCFRDPDGVLLEYLEFADGSPWGE
jgi:catechol 2,3-dioxygenase-like lactoylglutathione lyase family enzyme